MNNNRLTLLLVTFAAVCSVLFAISILYPSFVYVLFGGFAFLVVVIIPAFLFPLYLNKKTEQKLSMKKFELMKKYYTPIYLKRHNDNDVSLLTITVHTNETRTVRDYSPIDPILISQTKSISSSLEEQLGIDVLDTYIWQVDQYNWKRTGVPTNKTAKMFFLIGTNEDIDVDEIITDISIASISDLNTTFISTELIGITDYMYEYIGEKDENLDIEKVDPGKVPSIVNQLIDEDGNLDIDDDLGDENDDSDTIDVDERKDEQ